MQMEFGICLNRVARVYPERKCMGKLSVVFLQSESAVMYSPVWIAEELLFQKQVISINCLSGN